MARSGADFLTVADSAYPKLLREIHDPPIGVYRKGAYQFELPCIAIVGSRRPTLYGVAIAKRLGSELARIGFCVVSGLARGIDTAAHEGALEAFERTLHINLTAPYACCLAARPFMRAGGSIINVTSIGSVLGMPGNPAYGAAKGGLRLLTKSLALDYGAAGIRVNALAPGYIETDMTAKSFADPAAHERRRAHTCLGRWGKVEDLVGTAIFLASDASSYITGQDLFVDGGWTAKGLV